MVIAKPASNPFPSILPSSLLRNDGGRKDFPLTEKGKLVKLIFPKGRKHNIFYLTDA